MRVSLRAVAIILLCLGAAVTSTAQEGHPLKGSWIGVWQGNQAHGDSIVVILDWDGRAVSGIINPGTDNIDIASVDLDPEDWTVRIEASGEDAAGKRLNYVIDGEIQDLALPSRSIVGRWRHQDGSGSFEISRQ